MAAPSDTQRAAIRERKRQAHIALRQRLDDQQRLHNDAFTALDRLARHLDHAATTFAATDTDPLQRAATLEALAGQLAPHAAAVRAAAARLVADTPLTQADVAELLGIARPVLFPRTRPTTSDAGP